MGQASGKRGATWACSLSVAVGSPPWQSEQPRWTVSLTCGSCDVLMALDAAGALGVGLLVGLCEQVDAAQLGGIG